MDNFRLSENITFQVKMLWLIFRQLLENLGYLLLQHMVTPVSSDL